MSSNLLACQKDSYITEGTSKVISCTKGETAYHVVLADSVLYPEGGGQPWDYGVVAGMKVEKVVKGVESNQVVVELPNPLVEGMEVQCSVDWTRRYDFMQQHTAQHLFSAVADKLFKAETTGWSLGAETVSVDLSTPILLTAAEIQEIEAESNRMIASGASVNWKMYSKEEILGAESAHSEIFSESLESSCEHAELSLLRGGPKGAAMDLDELRMVHIEGLDLNPCGGTHLRGLNEINVLKVLGFDKDNNRKCVRVRFLAGLRALNYYRDCINREVALSSHFSVPPAQHPDAAEKLLKEKRDLTKRLDVYGEELAELYALSLLSQPEKNLNKKGILDTAVSDAATAEVPVFAYHRPGADLKFVVRVATTILAAYQKQQNAATVPLVFISGDDGMPVFTSVLDPPKAAKPSKASKGKPVSATSGGGKIESGISGPFVLFGDEGVVQKLREPLLGLIHGKGGGRPGKLQGTAACLDPATLAGVRALLLSAAAAAASSDPSSGFS